MEISPASPPSLPCRPARRGNGERGMERMKFRRRFAGVTYTRRARIRAECIIPAAARRLSLAPSVTEHGRAISANDGKDRSSFAAAPISVAHVPRSSPSPCVRVCFSRQFLLGARKFSRPTVALLRGNYLDDPPEHRDISDFSPKRIRRTRCTRRGVSRPTRISASIDSPKESVRVRYNASDRGSFLWLSLIAAAKKTL